MSRNTAYRLDIDALFTAAQPSGLSSSTASESHVGPADAPACKLIISHQYSHLRGAIAQLAGALLLYRNASRFEPDAVMAMADEAGNRADHALRVLPIHGQGIDTAIVRACISAAVLLRSAAKLVSESLHSGGGGLDLADLAFEPVRQAHLVLSGAASDRDGCTMIAFDGCCCCSTKKMLRM
jgi:hypothetical protein